MAVTEQTISPTRPETRHGFAAALRHPAFVVLWLSEAVSLVGDRLIMVALVTLVYERTRSPAAVGILMLLKAIPALGLGSVAGVFVDRWDRKWVLVGSNLIQGLLVALIPLTDALPIVFAIYFGMSVVNQFFLPARAATIPDLVPPNVLLAANSLFAAAFVGAIAAGPALGGWIAERFGLDIAFYADAMTFLVPALAVGLLTIPRTRRAPTGHNVGADLREGLVFVRQSADMLSALALTLAAFLIVGTMSVLGVAVAQESLNVGAGGFGMMMSAMGVGMLAGAAGAGWLGRRFDRTRLGAAGAGLMGMAVMTLPWVAAFYPALALAALIGFGMTLVQVSSQTNLQIAAPEHLRGRVMGLGQALMGGAQLLATALAGLLAERVGTETVLFGIGLAALAAGGTILIRRRNR